MSSQSTAPRDLERLIEVHDVVRSATAGLLHASGEAVDGAVDDALRTLGTTMAVGRVYVFRVDDAVLVNTHEWCASGVAPQITDLQEVPVAAFHHWLPDLRAGEPVHVADVHALPDARAEERDSLLAQDIASLVVVPMTTLGRWWGLVGLDVVDEPRAFDPGEIALLRSLADVLTVTMVNADAERRVATSRARLAALTATSTELVTVVVDGRVQYASPAWGRLGHDPGALVGQPVDGLFDLDDARGLLQVLRSVTARAPDSARVDQLPDLRLDGVGSRTLRGTVRDLRHEPAVGGLVLSQHDVTEQLAAERQLAHEARHDPLTGLANRFALRDHVEQACRAGDVTGQPVHVLFVDLDGFKHVNDSRGHVVGDSVLVDVAGRLRRAAGDDAFCARFGGDEFVVVRTGPLDDLPARLLAAARVGVTVNGQPHVVTASVGVSCHDGGPVDPHELVREADVAMFNAKGSGRNRVGVYDEEARAANRRAREVVLRLGAALDAGAVVAHHQSLVDLRSGAVVGHEALARWTDERLGSVSPVEFIPVAEETGMIGRLGNAVLLDALRVTAQRPAHEYVSVNLSAAQLTSHRVVEEVTAALDATGVTADRLVIEVTESLVMHDPATSVELLAELRSLGVRVAMDDFGTGHSSMALLLDLPLDICKIDRAFVQHVHDDARSRSMVAAIVGICEELGLQVVAEGIETVAQRDALQHLGCAIGQGWLFGGPAPLGPGQGLGQPAGEGWARRVGPGPPGW